MSRRMHRFVFLILFIAAQLASAENFDELWLSKTFESKETYVLGYIDGTLSTIAKNSNEGVVISANIPNASEVSAVVQNMDLLYENHDLGNIYFQQLMPLAISKSKWPEYDLGPSIRGLKQQAHNKVNQPGTR